MRVVAVLAVAVLALVAGPTVAACPPRQVLKVEVKSQKAAIVVEKKTVVNTVFEVQTEVTAAAVRTVRVARPSAVVVESRKVTFTP